MSRKENIPRLIDNQHVISRSEFLSIMGYGTFLGMSTIPLISRFNDVAHHLLSIDDDILTIRNRLKAFLAEDPPSAAIVRKYINVMQSDGSWSTINYDTIKISNWSPEKHLTHYVLPLTKAYANPDHSFFKIKALKKTIHQALDFWLNNNFTSQNWWYNVIGVPQALCEILILFDKEVSLNELLKALNQMRGSEIKQTGQNRVWRAEIQIMMGLLIHGVAHVNLSGTSSLRKINDGRDVLMNQLRITQKEGIQPDWSFHQHRSQLQFGNYGLSFALDEAKWSWLFHDTKFSFDQERIKVLSHFILLGLCWDTWKGRMDISGLGRQLFPNSSVSKAEGVIKACKIMLKSDPENVQRYQEAIKSLSPNSTASNFFMGTRYYYRSAMLINRTVRHCFTLRMCSKKVQSTESGNGENLKGAHLSDGALYTYVNGREYEHIFPVWNWHHIPGVTCYAEKELPDVDWVGLHNGNNFVGGVSDKHYGVGTMFFERNGLKAKKAWFFTDDGVVCLGSNISSGQQQRVTTTLNQCLGENEIKIATTKGLHSLKGLKNLKTDNLKYVYHHKTGYVFLSKNEVYVGLDRQSGAWRDIYEAGSTQKMQHTIFNLWIDHGVTPRNGSYAYMILPSTSLDEVSSRVQKSSVNIIHNTADLQAVFNPSYQLLQAVFYKAGSLNYHESNTLKVDAPCCLMARKGDKDLTISIADPLQEKRSITVEVSGAYTGHNSQYQSSGDHTILSVSFPQRKYAGDTVSLKLHAI